MTRRGLQEFSPRIHALKVAKDYVF